MKSVLINPERNKCFTKGSDPKCGDLEVDAGEECDGGSKEISALVDPCCQPPGSALQCKKREDIECHPSEGTDS